MKTVYCKKCGSVIDNESGQCTGCGKKYFRIRKLFSSKVLIWILVIACTGLAGCSYFWYTGYNYQLQQVIQLNEELAKNSDELKTAKSRLSNLSIRYSNLQTEYDKSIEKTLFLDTHIVFTTPSGNKYHSYDCYHLRGHSTYHWFKEDAESAGYEPCADCQ